MTTPPQRRRVGIAPQHRPPAQRLHPSLRYPAMFPTTTGRLVWDGHTLWHATGPDRRTALTALERTGTLPRVSIDDGARIHPAPGPGATPIDLAPSSAARFARFAAALEARGAVHVDHRAPSPAPGTGGADLVDRLERLAALHRAGDLDAGEYARAKALLLDG